MYVWHGEHAHTQTARY
ncbi:MAG: hypothetical protein AB7V08_03250 [Elusimicrobiales bacterium]